MAHEIKTPISIRRTGSTLGLKDANQRFIIRKTVNMLPTIEQYDELLADFNEIVTAINDHARLEAENAELRTQLERYAVMFADENFGEMQGWSYRPDYFDKIIAISQFAHGGKWTWFDENGKVLPDAPLFDSPLEAFEELTANRPQEQSVEEEKQK